MQYKKIKMIIINLATFYRYQSWEEEEIQFFPAIPKMDTEIRDALLLSFVAFIFNTVAAFLKFHTKHKRLTAAMFANIILFIITLYCHNLIGQCINFCQFFSWFFVYYCNCSENEKTKFKKKNIGSYSDEDQIVWG